MRTVKRWMDRWIAIVDELTKTTKGRTDMLTNGLKCSKRVIQTVGQTDGRVN